MRDFTDQERMTTLRGLVARTEWAGLCSSLEEAWPYDVLQFIGEGLRSAVLDGTQAAAAHARRCAAELRERDWDGDAELASELDAALGNIVVVADLTPLPVDLEELSMSLEGDPMQGGGRIDLMTGEVWPELVLETLEEDLEDEDNPARWLWFESLGSRRAFRDMELFIDQVQNASLARRLERALDGRGPFRRFKDTLWDADDDLTRWHNFSSERRRGRARAWLAGEGYQPVSQVRSP